MTSTLVSLLFLDDPETGSDGGQDFDPHPCPGDPIRDAMAGHLPVVAGREGPEEDPAQPLDIRADGIILREVAVQLEHRGRSESLPIVEHVQQVRVISVLEHENN